MLVKDDIRTYLENLPKYTPTFASDIARQTNHDKNSVGKYIQLMYAKGEITNLVNEYEVGGLRIYVRKGGDEL